MKVGSYQFKDRELFLQAITHPSYAAENKGALHYERFEFLGDSVLSLVISDMLISKFPNEKEGDLAKRRAALVCRDSLSAIARKIGLSDMIRLGAGEENNGGRDNNANLENVMEAIIAAIYRDGGFESAKKFIFEWFDYSMSASINPPKDAKTTLQEWAQARGLPLPNYVFEKADGPAHMPEFSVILTVEGFKPVRAKGGNKKAAQQKAAEKWLNENL